MSDQSETAPITPEAPAQTETAPQTSEPPAWMGPIEQRMNDLRDQNFALAEQFQNLLTYEEEDEAEIEALDEQGNLTPEAAQAIIDSRVEAMLSHRLGEMSARDALTQRNQEYNLLREQIPELQKDDYATELIREIADELSDAGFEQLIKTPLFVDLIEQRHKARAYDERATSEFPPERGVVLESATGAAPQQRSDEVDWAERVAQAAERAHPKI